MKKHVATICIIIVMVLMVPMGVGANQVEAVSNFTIDLSNQYRPATQVASGALYGLAEEGRPADHLIAPTKPKMFTQMAPGGTHFPNGETSALGDALVVAPIAERNGASVTIRMPDIYPNFPYQWTGWHDWLAKVDSIVNDTLASGATNIYGYELWNEPEWTWDWDHAGDFFAGWKTTYERVRSLDPNATIIGPSTTHWRHDFITDFMTYARNNNVLPDIVSWHELGAPEGSHVDQPAPWAIQNHINEYRALESSLGISPRPISINEYGTQTEEGVPGNMVQYFAQFERGGVDTANAAFWYRPGRLSNIITDSGEANGGWWLYKWYGDMSGQMVMTTPHSTTSTGLDGIASLDQNKQVVHALFGGSEGTANIAINGIGSVPFLGNTVHVQVEATPWYGVDTTVSQPIQLFEGDFNVSSGQIIVPVKGMKETWGYHMIITPTGTDKTRYEAEHATVNNAHIFNHSNASNAQYVGQIDHADSFVQYNVNVPTAGYYHLNIWYANGMGTVQAQNMSVNGSTAVTINYPDTGGWIWAERPENMTLTVQLNQGSNTIRFTKVGFVEHDYIELTRVPLSFEQRWEAEDALINQAHIFKSSYGSDARYVGMIDHANSYVEFNVHVPTTRTYTMEVGYGNGTSNNSTHQLTINGAFATNVIYPPTGGWIFKVPNFGTRQTVTTHVNLIAGNNTIRFTKGTSYAELDYIKLKE